MTHQPDDALHLALRCLTRHRAALRHDRHARVSETALADWARAHAISLGRATRSQHPQAQGLRQHLRAAARARRHRDRLLQTLARTRAVSMPAIRAKLSVARLFIDDARVAALLDGLVRDLRHRQAAH